MPVCQRLYYSLEQTHAAIRPLLEAYFPVMSGVRVIAEPGTFYVSSSFTLVVNVIGKKLVARDHHAESKGGFFDIGTENK